eukprot:m.258328 g.258328  ORF g.258328 m.258328 type:complete len:120 (+) comp36433_c0_seq1:133-492(+)
MFGVTATITRGARRQLMRSKRGNKNYYKGRRCNPTGFHTRKGGYQHDLYRSVQFIVPDLTGFELKPYISFKAAKNVGPITTADDILSLGASPEVTPQPTQTEQPTDGTSLWDLFSSKKK